MRIALIQTKQNRLYHFPSSDRFSKEEVIHLREEIVTSTLTLIEEAARNGVDLILTSEAFNYAGQPWRTSVPYTEFFPADDHQIEDTLSEIAGKYNTYIHAGLIRNEQGLLYNSTVLFDRSGQIMDVYHKIHLAGDENDVFTPGTKLHCIDTEFGKLGTAICWDMQFPETARTLARMGCDMILCPTWGWEWIYGPARAYENGIYVAAAMTVPYWMPIQELRKPSQVVSPEGTILAEGSYTDACITYCTVSDIHCEESRSFRLDTKLRI